jgi:hypothetical protein
MSRKVTAEEKQKIVDRTRIIGGTLVRLGRAYRECLLAPNREENSAQEQRFYDALNDLVILILESDL